MGYNKDLKIEYVPVGELQEYEKNARKHSDEDVGAIVESIREFGFDDPIGVWHGVVVEGHGRLMAAKRLKMKEVPVIRLDHLTDEQRRAYALAHNKTAELSEWDFDTLDMEIGDISLDMSRFGFDFEEPVERFEEDFGAERDRTDKGYNLHLLGDELLTPDFWQMPVIQNDGVIPDDLIGFNYVKSTSNTNNGVHFYIDDYQFERIWNKPEQYVDLLARHQCIISPDFSLYLDMPMPMKIWNVYRANSDRGEKVNKAQGRCSNGVKDQHLRDTLKRGSGSRSLQRRVLQRKESKIRKSRYRKGCKRLSW